MGNLYTFIPTTTTPTTTAAASAATAAAAATPYYHNFPSTSSSSSSSSSSPSLAWMTAHLAFCLSNIKPLSVSGTPKTARTCGCCFELSRLSLLAICRADSGEWCGLVDRGWGWGVIELSPAVCPHVQLSDGGLQRLQITPLMNLNRRCPPVAMTCQLQLLHRHSIGST